MSKVDISKYLLGTSSKDKWKKIGTSKRSGVVVPLFSVYSHESLGIGDFEDLKMLIDWIKKTGNSFLQLLPMNEVGMTFCPYDSLSSFALEPMYVSIERLRGKKKNIAQGRIEGIRKSFPAGKLRADYRIKQEKINLLREIYAQQERCDIPDFKKFKQQNSYWLEGFALYKVIKDFHKGSAWYEWQDQYKQRQPSALSDFSKQHQKEIEFQMWVQWLLYEQFSEAKRYADSKSVLIKGDLPILVSTDSADVWSHPEFFKLEFAAGAPPDMYCEKGQRWGTPTYNWENIAADNYRYLKEKLSYAHNFYDMLRIDHVVGLFRIWSIPVNEPMENKGFKGFFDPQDQSKWGEQGRRLLSVILESTDMLLCAEDLGTIPKICPQVLEELGIPGNDVQRWVKDWQQRHDFLMPNEYRSISVAMLSTHDTTNWAAWWENEAGTVDEALFMRKCRERGIDFESIKNRLFDQARSRHARLRWQDAISSVDILLSILGKKKEEVMDFIDMYENSYKEKEKLWKQLKLKYRMREKSDKEIISSALKLTLDSNALICAQLITDWLSLTDIFKGDPYQYRINTPGTVSQSNWSLRLPVCLEELLKLDVCQEIKDMVISSHRK